LQGTLTLDAQETLMHFFIFRFTGAFATAAQNLKVILLMVFVVVMFSGLLKVQFQWEHLLI
jgi:hypothetical protein